MVSAAQSNHTTATRPKIKVVRCVVARVKSSAADASSILHCTQSIRVYEFGFHTLIHTPKYRRILHPTSANFFGSNPDFSINCDFFHCCGQQSLPVDDFHALFLRRTLKLATILVLMQFRNKSRFLFVLNLIKKTVSKSLCLSLSSEDREKSKNKYFRFVILRVVHCLSCC